MTAAVFWISLALVFYAYAGYPLLVALYARLRGRVPQEGPALPALTVVVAAYNEQDRIAARIRDILEQDYPAERLQVLVVSDGSNDDTAHAAAIGDPRVTVRALARNGGKALAVNAAMTEVHTPLVAFTDVRQRYAPGALRALVAAFADPRVGVVSGELVIGAAEGGAAEGVGLYWRMEKKLRADEAALGWLHGVTGAVYAMRREVFKPLPAGTVLDDMWVPLQAILAGHWVWMARDAIAHDRASGSEDEEFRRKLRTLAGNWQLMALLPVLWLPWRNPVFFAWCSHKVARLLVPWALLAALLSAAVHGGRFYSVALGLQLLAYAAAVLALWQPRLARRIPLMPVAGTFLMLNLAALLSLPASFMGTARLWKKH